MHPILSRLSRRQWLARVLEAGAAAPLLAAPRTLRAADPAATPPPAPDPLLEFPGPWSFNRPKGAFILVTDQQLEELEDPDREVDLSLSSTPDRTTLRRRCQHYQEIGARTVILAFDHFFAQYRQGQGAQPRRLMPDTDEYIRKVARLSETLKAHGLGFELSVLSPLELGPGYARSTGESGRWVQYREGLRDPATGRYRVQLWEHRRWTNNKGPIELERVGVRVFAFRERRLGGTPYHVVDPAGIVELPAAPAVEVWEGAIVQAGTSFAARRLEVSGVGDTGVGPLDRVLVVVSYRVPEMDYFSPKARPFLEDLIDRYHRAGVPLNGLYADEMHIQQDWVYHSHHDEGQFTLRYLTPHLARDYAERYGAEFADFEKYLVYFCYAQHGFASGLEAALPAQHVLGDRPEDIQRTFLLRRRYYDLLTRRVVGLFTEAREYAERQYGHELEARAHATWAQSPTIDRWDTGPRTHAPRQYEYTSNFQWSNTVQQAASACDDYFRWNDFLSGGGNDHTEGGWSDRNYYALALACSTGILNRVPYAYAAHWGMPGPAAERRQALVDAYGAAASPSFQAIENSEHRDIEVLFLYPMSLVACEERFGSWMVQYGYANYVTPDVLLARGRVTDDGALELAGRRFTTLAVLFEPLPPAGLIELLDRFAARGGRVVWSGPPPRLDFAAAEVGAAWRALFGVGAFEFQHQGLPAPGEEIRFEGRLQAVPAQRILTHFLVDHTYPVTAVEGVEVVARWGNQVAGLHRRVGERGSATYLGFRPRDDQAASLGAEVRTWFEILSALGAYPKSAPDLATNDNPSVVSRLTPYLSCRFPNGTVTLAVHYRHHVESWTGGFHRDRERDREALERNPLPPDRLEFEDFHVAGHRIGYRGRLVLAFRPGPERGRLLAFGGYDCAGLALDGTEHRFADEPLRHLAWAPVAENRRVPGGAVLELWVHGNGEVRIPLPPGLGSGRLFAAGRRPGSPGEELPARCENGELRFATRLEARLRHLYWVG